MSKKIQEFMDKITEDFANENFYPICGTAYGIHVMLFLIGFAFKKNFLILELLSMLAGFISIMLLCPKLDEGKQKVSFAFLCTFPIFMISALVSTPVLKASKKIIEMGGTGKLSILAFMAVFLTIACFVAFYFSDKGKEIVELAKESLKSGAVAAGGAEEKQHGDVQLCIEKESGKPEIWLHKDRYLHMLILGPTGSGKTSQTILPLINQDMQNPEMGITVLEPKGDLAQKAAMMAEHYGRKSVYFDPSFDNCPFFNPLFGKESDVVENMATTFRMLNPDSPQFFLDLNEQLMRNAVKVLKRLDKAEGVDGRYATFISLSTLLQNTAGKGRGFVQKFSQINAKTQEEAKENTDIASWFLNDYFAEKSKTYENTSGVRSQVSKLVSNKFLRRVLNPDFEKGERNDIDFDKHLADGGIICISTAQGTLRDLGKYLGYFIILQLQSSVFRRPGNENTRRAHMLYIDEFQTYSNPGFSDMLTQGRSYRVASHLATQARAQMAMGGGKDGKNFVELVSTNARNIVLYPGCSKDDAEYYSKQFGEYEKTEVQIGKSYKTFNLLTGGLDKLGHPTETIREAKKMTAIFSPSDLIYRPFGEIVYCIIKKNSIQTPKVGQIEYIPRELNEELDKMVDKYIEEHLKSDDEDMSQTETTETKAPEDELPDLGEGQSMGMEIEMEADFDASDDEEPVIPHLAEAMEAPKQEEFVIDPQPDGAVEMEIDGGGFLDDDDDTDDDF